MHRLITDCPDGLYVDHIDGNPMNNTRENLRICTQAENAANSKARKGTFSKYKGVHFSKQSGKYRTRIMIDGEITELGSYKTPEEAAVVYKEASRNLLGDFCLPENGGWAHF